MIYRHPKPEGSEPAGAQSEGASLPSNPEVKRLKAEVAQQYRKQARDEKRIKGLEEKLQDLSDRWAKNRVKLTTIAHGLRDRALEAEGKNTLLEHDEMPRLRERFERLEGTEEALQNTANGIAHILDVLGKAAARSTFTGRSPTELAAFISDKVAVVSEAIEGLRDRIQEGRDRLQVLKDDNAELVESNQQLEPLKAEVAKLHEEIEKQADLLKELQGQDQKLKEAVAVSRDEEQDWLADPSKKDLNQICSELKVVSASKEAETAEYDKALQAIHLDPDSSKKLSQILTVLTQAGQSLEQVEANLESKKYEEICKARVACEQLITDYLHHYQSVDFLLRINPELTEGIVSRLNDSLAERLMAAYLVNPAQDHILSSQRLLSLVEKLPASHAAMALNSSESEVQLSLLFGSASVRAAVSMLVERLPRKEIMDLDVAESLERLQKIITTPVDEAERSAYANAARVLRVLEHVPEDTLSALVNKYNADKESRSKSTGVLGYDLRYALSLAQVNKS